MVEEEDVLDDLAENSWRIDVIKTFQVQDHTLRPVFIDISTYNVYMKLRQIRNK